MWGGIGPGVVSSCMGDYCLTGSSPGTEERANKTKPCVDLVVRTNGYKRLPGDKFPPREAESVSEEAYRQGGHEGPVREEFSLEGAKGALKGAGAGAVSMEAMLIVTRSPGVSWTQ